MDANGTDAKWFWLSTQDSGEIPLTRTDKGIDDNRRNATRRGKRLGSALRVQNLAGYLVEQRTPTPITTLLTRVPTVTTSGMHAGFAT